MLGLAGLEGLVVIGEKKREERRRERESERRKEERDSEGGERDKKKIGDRERER